MKAAAFLMLFLPQRVVDLATCGQYIGETNAPVNPYNEFAVTLIASYMASSI